MISRPAAVGLLAAALLAAGAGPAAGQVRADTAVFDPESGALHRCWEKAAAEDFRVAGQVVVRVTRAQPVGIKVDIVSDSTGSPVLTRCVTEVAGRWDLSALPPGADGIEIPLAFRAPGAQYTVRAEDVTAVPVTGARGLATARVLLDARSVGAAPASLVLIEGRRGAELPLGGHAGTAALVVLDGRASISGPGRRSAVARSGEVITLAPGVGYRIRVAGGKGRTRLLVTYTPPGPERALRVGATPPAPGATLAPATALTVRATALPTSTRLDLAGDEFARTQRLSLPAGQEQVLSTRGAETELLFVTAGAAELVVDEPPNGQGGEGGRYPVEAGMAVYLPAGARLAVKVATGGPLQAVRFHVPGSPDRRPRDAAP